MTGRLSKSGLLYIVATPIGNLGDITIRATEVLSKVDLIAAEDTRHSGMLLASLGISNSLCALHEHNEVSQTPVLIEKILNGKHVALISDAGTPLISDPGFRLVDLAHENKITVVPVPGASSVMAALSASGISVSSYSFVGFLPAKKSHRKKSLELIKNKSETIVIFESPHRIVHSLDDMIEVLGGDRKASFCRELTKRFETIYRGKLNEIKQFIDDDENQKRGEMVVILSPQVIESQQMDHVDYPQLLAGMLKSMSLKDASTLLASVFHRPRKVFYEMGLDIKNRHK